MYVADIDDQLLLEEIETELVDELKTAKGSRREQVQWDLEDVRERKAELEES